MQWDLTCLRHMETQQAWEDHAWLHHKGVPHQWHTTTQLAWEDHA